MAPDQRGEVGDVVVADVHAVQPDLANGFLHVDGVAMHDGVERQAKGAKLLFLSLLEWAADFAAFAVMDAPSEAMAQFRVVELGQDAPSERRVVDVVEDVDRLGDPADFGQRARQGGRLVPDLERPHDAGGLEMPKFQRAYEADDIGPIIPDQREIDDAFAEFVERTVIGFAIDPPQLDVAEVGQARAELITEQPEDAEYRIGVRSGIGHEFGRLQLGFLFEEKCQQHGLSRRVPGTTIPLRPLNWFDIRLYQVTPRDWPKYFGFGPAWMALAGAVKRMPSAEATAAAPVFWTGG